MRIVSEWNEHWKFKKCDWEDQNPALAMGQGEDVVLPHTWYEDGDYYRGSAVYQKNFQGSWNEKQKVFVKFHGVDKICRVFLNGELMGEHQGGYSMFTLELTSALKEGNNLLTVYVNNENGSTVCPLSGDFTIFGGIHRKVELIVTELSCFDGTYYGTDGLIVRTDLTGSQGVVYAEPHVMIHSGQQASVRYRIYDAAKAQITEAVMPAGEDARITVPAPVLWDGKRQPYLYQITAELLVSGQVADSLTRQIGFYSIKADADKGFFLNGKHLKLNGVAKHQDTAGVFSAASEEHWNRDMELIEEIGANAVRLSHYQHPQYFYDLCDRKGILVWAEIPLLKLTLDEGLFANAKQQLKELILQNMHHVSICMWGLQNEIAIFGEKPYMYDRMEELQKYAEELDPGRLTTSANLNSVGLESRLNRITDVVGYNLYYGWYYGEMKDFAIHLDEFHRLNPNIPVGISEYGVDCNINFHSDKPEVKDYTEEFQAKFHETVYPMLKERDFVWGTFIWNMFDFVSGIRNEGGVKLRNNKGLVTHDRKICKDSFYYYKAQWSEEPFVHIAQKRFQNRASEQISVKVYSNIREVTLKVHEKEYCRQSENGVFLFEDIPLFMGENEIEACAGSSVDRACFVRKEEPDQSYVFVDPNPGINVRNWFEDEAQRARLFPEDAYSIMDTINALLECPEAMAVIDRMQPKLGAFMRETIGTFTLEQGLIHDRELCSEEDVRSLNQCLIKIKKSTKLQN